MSLFVGMFWALAVNDMIGDNHPNRGIVASVGMILWCPLLFVSLQKLLKPNAFFDTDNSISTNNIATSFTRNMDRVRNRLDQISLYIHSIIWRYLLLAVASHVSNDDDNRVHVSTTTTTDRTTSTTTITNTTSADRTTTTTTTINETISPLGSLNSQINSLPDRTSGTINNGNETHSTV